MEDGVKQRIRLLIKEKAISLNSLSEKINIPQNTLSRQINGKTAVSTEAIVSIIGLWSDVSAEWLLRGKGEMIKQPYPGETLIKEEDKDEYKSSIVYHYTKIDSFISILSDLRLKCSIIDKSNDYKEKESLKEMLFHNRPFNSNLRYLSFCYGPLSYRNPVLWHHYANAHNGVCIGIDTAGLDKTILGGKVIYERNINNDKYNQEEYMMRKTPEWMGELEYRLIFPDGREFFDIKDCLYSVCFGRDINENVIKMLAEIIPVNVRIYKMDGSSNGYMGRHELSIDSETVLSGSRKSLNSLEENVVAEIRNKLFALREMEKQPSRLDPGDNIKLDINMDSKDKMIQILLEKIDALEKANAELRRKYEPSEERPAM